ncbi:MAG: beta-lactamase family protein [Halanaerobiales bacterium]|nr:beta-lactamase family protein [Halanaerobiales bacterium]
MKKLKLVLIALVLVTSFMSQSTIANYSKEIKKINELIESEIKKNNIQGFSVAIVDEDGIIWSKGYGFQDVKNEIIATPETLYRIGSATKSFTATGIMLLIERGLVELDAPITKYIPFEINSLENKSTTITVRQLLNHHSGLKRDLYKDIRSANPPKLDFLLSELRDDYLALAPDSLYKYSNIGYALLGKIIENVSNKSYSQFISEELFTPLGMLSSEPGLNNSNIDYISKSYKIQGGSKKANEIEQLVERDQPAGSIISSVEGLAKFMQFILNEGKTNDGQQLLSKESLDQMFTIQYPDNDLDDDPYGLGWKINKSIIPNTEINIRHGGTLTGFSSLMVALPEEKLGIAILYNTNQLFSRHYIANEALKILASEKVCLSENNSLLHEEKILDLQPDDFGKYTGRYVGIGDIPIFIDLSSKNDKFNINLQGTGLSLKTRDDKRFRVVKQILFLNFGIGSFMGVDDVFLDFYRANNGIVYPRLILKYEDLEMKIVMEKVNPYEIPQTFENISGTYLPTQESEKHVYSNSFSVLTINVVDGWIVMKTTWEGSDLELLLKPVNENKLITYGSGEVVTINDNLLYYSGLVFEKK